MSRELRSAFRNTYTAGPNIRGTKYAKGRIKSKGRGDPPAPQGLIVMTVDSASNKIRRTHDESKWVAPMSDDSAVNRVIRGEVALIDADSYDTRGVRPGLNGGATVQITTNVNGWSIDANTVVGGIMTFSGIGHGEDNTQDNAATMVMAGKTNTRNTGPELIPAFSHVYVTADPYKALDGEGKVMPAIEDPGLPNTKYLPATHPMNSASVLTLIKRIKGTVHETFQQKGPKTAEDLKAYLLNNNIKILDIHESHPLYQYSVMYAASLLMYFYKDNNPMGWEEKKKFCTYALNLYNDWDTKTKTKYAASLSIYDHKQSNKRYRSEDYGNPDEERSVRFKTEVIHFCQNATENLQEKQHDCLNQTYLGLALSSAAPGKPMDILVGHSHW